MRISSITRRIRKSTVFQEVAGRVYSPLVPDYWIFVVGCYNSGTSLLSSLIAAHPECSGASNEGVALTTELARPEQFGWPRMWLKCQHKLMAPDNGEVALQTADLIKRQWRASFDKEASCIVEKSISNGLRIEFLSKYFAPAKFIHITRDGLAVAEGIRRKAKPALYSNPEGLQRYPLELCLDQWVAANSTIRQSLSKQELAPNTVSVSYEELCECPKDVLATIFSKLGLSNTFLETDRSMIEKIASISNMNKKSYDSLDSIEIETLRRRYKKEFEAFGYSCK